MTGLHRHPRSDIPRQLVGGSLFSTAAAGRTQHRSAARARRTKALRGRRRWRRLPLALGVATESRFHRRRARGSCKRATPGRGETGHFFERARRGKPSVGLMGVRTAHGTNPGATSGPSGAMGADTSYEVRFDRFAVVRRSRSIDARYLRPYVFHRDAAARFPCARGVARALAPARR